MFAQQQPRQNCQEYQHGNTAANRAADDEGFVGTMFGLLGWGYKG